MTSTGDIKEIQKPESQQIEPIYNVEELNFENVKANPILKPISEINKSYENMELLVMRALWEYEKVQDQINDLTKINPKYNETILMAKVQGLLIYIKQIIHSQDIQKYNLKKAIREMIKISKTEYAPLDEDYVENHEITEKKRGRPPKDNSPKEENKYSAEL